MAPGGFHWHDYNLFMISLTMLTVSEIIRMISEQLIGRDAE
jgi:hypothetical protein